MKVLYIAGAGRSGSTLVDSILGQVDRVRSVGELRYVWQRGFLEDRTCGCGEPFSSCPFWTSVVEEAFGGPAGVDPQRMIDEQQRWIRIRHLPWLLLGRFPEGSESDAYRSALRSLYAALTKSGRDLVVDPSKLPTYGRTVEAVTGVELSVLHLVRDPRATAFSWTRTRALPDSPGRFMQRQAPAKSAALWSLWNRTAERIWADGPRYLRLRYEDFVASPREQTERILDFVGIEGAGLPFVTDSSVQLAPTHSVAGNPSRFRTGTVEIRADDEWRTALGDRQRRLVERLAGPLMRRYGYRRLE